MVSGTNRMVATITARPIGTLTQKIHSQEKDPASQPPSNGPTAAAPDMVAPQTPKAAARSLPRKTAFTVDRVAGNTIAPPTPCTTRARSSSEDEPESAAMMEPITKTVVPVTKSRFRPRRSPIRPVESSSAANTTE